MSLINLPEYSADTALLETRYDEISFLEQYISQKIKHRACLLRVQIHKFAVGSTDQEAMQGVTGKIQHTGLYFVSDALFALHSVIQHWSECIGALGKALTRLEARRRDTLQSLLVQTSDFSAIQNSVVDPMFISRPLIMWRFSLNNFRNDDGWKILGHIRQSHRTLISKHLPLSATTDTQLPSLLAPADGYFKFFKVPELGCGKFIEKCDIYCDIQANGHCCGAKRHEVSALA